MNAEVADAVFDADDGVAVPADVPPLEPPPPLFAVPVAETAVVNADNMICFNVPCSSTICCII